MNLLINLIPIKKGGGQQVATNFVENMRELDTGLNITYAVTRDTFLHNQLKEHNEKLIVVNPGLISRAIFSYLSLNKTVNSLQLDVIYTLFGPGLFHKKVLSITGCAYSNIFFPEIKFWRGYNFIKTIKLKWTDKFRLKNTLRSHAIIFENAAMQKRAIELFKYPRDNTKLILPSISTYKTLNLPNDFGSRLEKIDKSHFNVLMLTGWHKNKNIEIVPYVLKQLKVKGVEDVSFVITVDKQHPESLKLINVAKDLGVINNIVFFNSVLPNQVPQLFSKVNAVALFSLLESFSNNIIEAWYFKKPLIISNEEWSRSICGKGAVYVDRLDANSITDNILKIKCDIGYKNTIINKGESVLLNYPNPKQKVEKQLEFIKYIYEKNC